jgi:hypothetical protein
MRGWLMCTGASGRFLARTGRRVITVLRPVTLTGSAQ